MEVLILGVILQYMDSASLSCFLYGVCRVYIHESMSTCQQASIHHRMPGIHCVQAPKFCNEATSFTKP